MMNCHIVDEGHGTAAKAARVLEYLRASTMLPAVFVRPSRHLAISLIVAKAGPSMAYEELALLADIGLFIFAVDDLTDEGDVPIEELEGRLLRYADCAAGAYCPEVAFDPIARFLGSIAARLLRASGGDALFGQWAARVRELLAAMLAERRMSLAAASFGQAPSLREYLEVSRDSTGGAVVAAAAWMMMPEGPAAEAWPGLREAERHFSLAVRLANDLRGHERERGEGKLDALAITGADQRGALWRRATDAVTDGREALARLAPGAGSAGRFLDRFASSVVELYTTHDFHTLGEATPTGRGGAGASPAPLHAPARMPRAGERAHGHAATIAR